MEYQNMSTDDLLALLDTETERAESTDEWDTVCEITDELDRRGVTIER